MNEDRVPFNKIKKVEGSVVTNHTIPDTNPIPVKFTGEPTSTKGTKNFNGILSHSPEESYRQIIFQAGENNACALAFDKNNHVYIGTNTTPARIIKVNLDTMEEVASVTLPVGRDQTRISAMYAMDEDTIIHGSYTNPYILTRLNRNLEITGTLVGIDEAISDKHIRPMTSDGKYIYVGLDTVAGKIVKIDPYTMTRIDGRVLPNGANNVYGLTYLNGFLYAGCETSPAKIVKINPNNLNTVSVGTLDTGFDKAYSVVSDGRYLYIGCNTSPYRVAKFDPETMTQVSLTSYTAPTGENEIWSSLVFNGQHIIAGSWTEPAILTTLKTADLTVVDKITVPNGYFSKMMYIEPYLISPNDMSPARFTKILMPHK